MTNNIANNIGREENTTDDIHNNAPYTGGEKNAVELTIPAPEKSSRLLAALTLLFLVPKLILLIPHLIVLWFLRIAAFFAGVFGQLVVLFTGVYPVKVHAFVVGVLRWQTRVMAYAFGLRDEYPPFTLLE